MARRTIAWEGRVWHQDPSSVADGTVPLPQRSCRFLSPAAAIDTAAATFLAALAVPAKAAVFSFLRSLSLCVCVFVLCTVLCVRVCLWLFFFFGGGLLRPVALRRGFHRARLLPCGDFVRGERSPRWFRWTAGLPAAARRCRCRGCRCRGYRSPGERPACPPRAFSSRAGKNAVVSSSRLVSTTFRSLLSFPPSCCGCRCCCCRCCHRSPLSEWSRPAGEGSPKRPPERRRDRPRSP
mmetsp:Transcript_21289/g.44829  ORF Transcript_21289/g.44829 Transcript_21289/m.44829 type:complete len:237 (+) Transcript_21289:84-794(+)